MAEKFNEDNKLTPKELAKHLRQPEGEIGKEVGLQMNKGNKHICLNSYKVLNPKNKDYILEIGMGNGFFVKDLLKMADNLNYSGIDFSHIMINEATIKNKEFITSGKVSFKQASIEKLPFNDGAFDCITTTNTLYFWPQPQDNAKELLRVLKPGGKLLIAYRTKDFMEQLELTKYGFTKYNVTDVENLLNLSGFKQITSQMIKEPELDFDGKVFEMEGMYTTGIK
ncbi:class I SAM-dependent methyltransferase [Flavivirga aquimarina]|uniref:Class I SAM-dependent methyltransferase n=1 Tax=Flavivirga aquimarina TaxID=2027862 RepID=A0ABT8WAP5_9FLAO|nr:class I SAM-dependent methyltransferase [Flavivirga aquimarina]MDO5970219.1 class I SAM-dependent methyltransferase [Flavivirga aquimarina]